MAERVDPQANPLDQLHYGYEHYLLEELRALGVEVVELDANEVYKHSFKVYVPISADDPQEALSQNVLARVIARYWNARYSLEKNMVLPSATKAGTYCRMMEFVQTAPATARRRLD